MSRIVIDAREWSTSTGRYISNLVYNLEKTDSQNNYTVLLSPKDMAAWQPTNPKFQKIICPYKEFTFAEQIGYKRQLNGLKADLVHFGMAQQPAFYGGNSITTMNDLTTLRFRNLSKNLLIFKSKQLVYRWLNKRVAKKSAAIITYSQFVKDDVANFAHIDPGKITVTPLAAIKMTVLPEPVDLLVNKPFLLYVGRPMSHKNLERLAKRSKARVEFSFSGQKRR
jgi:glycosyltransferase involved in cell wall biosynthesis